MRSKFIFRNCATLLVFALALLVAVPAMGDKANTARKRKQQKTERVNNNTNRRTGANTKVNRDTKRQTTTTKRTSSQSSGLTGISTAKAVNLGLSVKWAGWNVGADAPEDYGGLYGWADATGNKRSTDLSDYPSSNPPSSICGDSRYDIARARWGSPWRLPTLSEIKELLNRCTWTWGKYKGVAGYKVKGPNGNAIFLPAAGYRYGSEVNDRGSYGYYWSGELNTSSTSGAYELYVSSGYHDWYDYYRYYGNSVRPVTE